MSSRTQTKLESQIEQYERIYKKHVMLKSELVEEKPKEKLLGSSKLIWKKRNEINLLEKKLAKEKGQGKIYRRKERTAWVPQPDERHVTRGEDEKHRRVD
jgi:hypothetical protein